MVAYLEILVLPRNLVFLLLPGLNEPASQRLSVLTDKSCWERAGSALHLRFFCQVSMISVES
jgi:hypothetical protein